MHGGVKCGGWLLRASKSGMRSLCVEIKAHAKDWKVGGTNALAVCALRMCGGAAVQLRKYG
jgi:hypothetical protein